MKLKKLYISLFFTGICLLQISCAEAQSVDNSDNTIAESTNQNEQVTNRKAEPTNRRGETFEFPEVVKSELDKRFPGWKFQKEREDILKYLKESVSPDARPEFIKGDFDGNGEQDYAVLFEQGKVQNEQGNDIGADIHLVAFLQKKNKFEVREIEDGYGDFLMLEEKGSSGYNYETDKNFTFKNDAVFSGIFEKAGVSYIYENDKFREIVTSD